MTDTPVYQQLVFTNKQEMIAPFLKDVVAFINQSLPEKASQLVFKVKMIITELLTNSIKHAGEESTLIELIASNEHFIIKRTDNGKPFYVKHPNNPDELLHWPLTETLTDPLEIYSDKLNGLFANMRSSHSLNFYTESYPAANEFFPDISEHYGLMIICRASNSFIYELESESLKNIFTATILFS